MLTAISTGLFILLFPAGYTLLHQRVKAIRFLDPVVASYVGGILVANQPFFEPHHKVASSITQATVILAIPLLLFSTDFGRNL